jgi:hypothetical protein
VLGSVPPLPSIVPEAASLVCVAVLLMGCGSSNDGPQRFHQNGFGITFEYPRGLKRTEEVSLSRSSGRADKTLALAVSKDSAIFVQRYGLKHAVTHANEDAARREIQAVLTRLSGQRVRGTRIKVGDLPAFRYEIDALRRPVNGRSTIVVVLDGRTEYFINCQSVPKDRHELEQACRQAIDTLAPKR